MQCYRSSLRNALRIKLKMFLSRVRADPHSRAIVGSSARAHATRFSSTHAIPLGRSSSRPRILFEFPLLPELPRLLPFPSGFHLAYRSISAVPPFLLEGCVDRTRFEQARQAWRETQTQGRSQQGAEERRQPNLCREIPRDQGTNLPAQSSKGNETSVTVRNRMKEPTRYAVSCLPATQSMCHILTVVET
jgi:hypothetical protein